MQFFTPLIPSLIISLALLPSTFTTTFTPGPVIDSADTAITKFAITQLLSLFNFIIDEKDFSSLKYIFTSDAVLDGGDGNALVGLANITAFYTNTFQNESLRTQHTSDTVYVYDFIETTASSVSYANVYYFGPKVFERGGMLFSNDSVAFREKIRNEYVIEPTGAWKIKRQTLFEILVSPETQFPFFS